jgi:hypothetical protein
MAAGVMGQGTDGAPLLELPRRLGGADHRVLLAWVASNATSTHPISSRRQARRACAVIDDAVRPAPVVEGQSLLEQAELAFAAGRIVEPEFDNAQLTTCGARKRCGQCGGTRRH